MIISLFRSDLLEALASTLPAAASPKGSRPHLACVVLRMVQGELRAYAANGHWLARYVLAVEVDAYEGAHEMALTVAGARALIASLKSTESPRVSVDFGAALVRCGALSTMVLTCDVPGADCEAIIRRSQPAAADVPRPPEVGLAIEYLAAVGKAAKAAGGATLHLFPGKDPLDPVMIKTHPHVPGWLAVLMPVRL